MSFSRLWWISLFVKLILAVVLPLASDEAYYWFWSHHLQWSYFDHPPMVAALMWLGHPLEAFGAGVRIPSVVLGHLTLLVWWALLKSKLSSEELMRWMWLALLTPLIGFGSLVVTPDLPLLFFWALSLLFFEKALKDKTALSYSALGLAMGLAFTSKYHAVLFVPVIFLYLTMEKKWREVAFRFIPLTIFFGLLGSLPVLYWNATNDWMSFRFQINHGLGRESWEPNWTLTYLIGQIVLMTPWLLPSLFRGFRDRPLRLIGWNAVFSWGFFLYSSFKAVVEANWPILSFHSGNALIAKGARSNRLITVTVSFWSLIAILVASHWIHPWIPHVPEKLMETHQYRSLAPLLEKYPPLYANTYQMASILSFEAKRDVYKLNDMSRFDFFDQLPQSFPSEKLYYLVRREGQNIPRWLRDSGARIESVEKVAPDFEVLKIEVP